MVESINLLKATRVYRTLQILMAMMIPTAFANTINKEVILLGISCILIYSAAGIHNAIRDKDYVMPLYSKKVMFTLLCAGLIISLSNHIIFFAAMAGILLGLSYNTFSRHILFGDSTILAITHYTLPCFSASLLLKQDVRLTVALTGFMFLTFWFLMHSKNLKDTEDDAKRGYKTLTTIGRNGKTISIMLLMPGFLSMFLAYFMFNLTNRFLAVFSIVFILQAVAIKQIISNENQSAVKLIRLLMMLFLFGIIIDRASSIKVILIPAFSFLSYLALLLTNSIAKEKYLKKAGVMSE
ncbi:UbiA family prenyltransferase [Candidatus Woesearchaeota archaeon]|nr:UbiA family prenyltransferase [Candidatus Woesearchaeota archaeon]